MQTIDQPDIKISRWNGAGEAIRWPLLGYDR